MPRYAVYCATKAGLNAWCIALRHELRGSGVRCVNVCPGFVTGAGMYQNMLDDMRKTSTPPRVPRLHLLWELSARRVAALTVSALKNDAQHALITTTAMPMRLFGALQSFAPDWATAWLLSPLLMPGDPFYMLHDEQQKQRGAERKEE